jgi:hypothetical protein
MEVTKGWGGPGTGDRGLHRDREDQELGLKVTRDLGYMGPGTVDGLDQGLWRKDQGLGKEITR